jgi:hypothetical protein
MLLEYVSESFFFFVVWYLNYSAVDGVARDPKPRKGCVTKTNQNN